MNFFKKLFQHTLTYKTYDAIYSFVQYVKDYNEISDVFYSEELIKIINGYLNIKLKKDWIGRWYGIINPNIDINGHIDFNNTIIEIDGENTNSKQYVTNWIYKQMNLISDLFKINKLYDYINVGIDHVGPKNSDNFLVVFDMVGRKEFAYSIKALLKHALIYICIAFIVFIVLYFKIF